MTIRLSSDFQLYNVCYEFSVFGFHGYSFLLVSRHLSKCLLQLLSDSFVFLLLTYQLILQAANLGQEINQSFSLTISNNPKV